MVKSTFKNLPVEKKERIEKALLEEFSSHSLSKAQVARIVRSAEIARGAFYKYFDDLEDAYTYLYAKAMEDIHMGVSAHTHGYDPDFFYQRTINFIEQAEQSKYRELIKLHLSTNQEVLDSPQATNEMMQHLDAQNWSAMILTHEVIKMALFDPKNRDANLKRYQRSLELLKGE